MTEEPQKKYRCGDCGTEWKNEKEKTCSNCGGTRRCTPVFVDLTVAIRSGLLLETHNNQTGEIERKVYSRSKQSGETRKEAREYRDIDIEHNRYAEHIDEQDEKGIWREKCDVHETLDEHNLRKQEKNKTKKIE